MPELLPKAAGMPPEAGAIVYVELLENVALKASFAAVLLVIVVTFAVRPVATALALAVCEALIQLASPQSAELPMIAASRFSAALVLVFE